MFFEKRVPPGCVELTLVDDTGHAVNQRSNDPVGCTRDPAGIGRAPENVPGMKIQNVFAGCIMGQHGLVHMDRSLGHAGGSAGKMKEGPVLGIGGGNGKCLGSLLHESGQGTDPSVRVGIGVHQ